MAWGGASGWGTIGWGTGSPPTVPALDELGPYPAKELRKLFGRDLFWDGDYVVASSGDWAIVEGEAALRQSIIRRIITAPGEWRTRPDYGVGARHYVKARRTPGVVDELKSMIKKQLLRDPRVAEVQAVDIDTSLAEVLKISVKVKPKGKALRSEPFVAKVEVT